MILIDFSAMAYQSLYSAVTATEPRVVDEYYETGDFASFMVYRILESIFETQDKFQGYGDVVLCLDGESKKNWRKKAYPMYKASRPLQRKQSKIKFDEVFPIMDGLVTALRQWSPYRVVRVPEAEGDDVIMVLAKELPGPTMIVSSDKDIIQMQRYPGIKQYSYMTQKFVTYEDKHEDSMSDWLLEHVVLGDAADDVPRVVDGLKFTPEFQKYLDDNNIKVDEMTVRNSDWMSWGFTERKGASLMPNIFERPRFGMTTARKTIEAAGGLEAWLDSDPRLRQNFEMNATLVLERGIPNTVRQDVMTEYQKADDKADAAKFEQFLESNGIAHMSLSLPANFKKTFSVEDLF